MHPRSRALCSWLHPATSPRGKRFHAEGIVDVYTHGLRSFEFLLSDGRRKIRLGKYHNKAGDGKKPGEQDQQVLQLRFFFRFLLDLGNEPYIGKPDLLILPEVKKMNNDRYRKCGKGN